MKQNRLILAITYSAIALFTLTSSSSVAQNSSKTLKRIIIDPGHGGTDPGSNGKYSTEAEVSLAISLKLEEYINQSIPDVEVILTRRTEIFNTVVEKANIANEAKGDLFICIHTNSANPSKSREIIGYTNKTYTVKKKGVKRKVTRRVPLYKTTYTPSSAKGTETFIYNVDKSEQKKKIWPMKP